MLGDLRRLFWRWLAYKGASRKSTIVALGGGVIGDLTGFVAASYMRGWIFFRFPRPCSAQVDLRSGGKVGVDLPSGKNMVGAFYPRSKPVDMGLLARLPARQFTNGMGEVWKYGAILDA